MLPTNYYTPEVSICQVKSGVWATWRSISGSLSPKYLKLRTDASAGMLDTFATDSVALRIVFVPA